MTDTTLTLSDIEFILTVWHGRFRHDDDAQRQQAIATHDKLDAIRRRLIIRRTLAEQIFKGAN